MSFSGINWLGVLLAVVANMIIGFVWYARWMPTGKIWMKAMKIDPKAKPTGGQMAKGLILMIIGAFLIMFVFAHTNWAYQDAFRNTDAGGTEGYDLKIMDGIFGGLFTWLGFFVPMNLGSVAWEGKSWGLFFVNIGYWFVTLVVAGILLVSVGTVG